MKNKIIFLLIGLASIIHLSCASSSEFQNSMTDSSLFNASEKPQLISRQFSFTEGPAKDKAGNIFFTDQPNNAIWKYSTKGKLDLYSDNSGRANGLFFDNKGNLIVCADENNQLWKIDQKGNKMVLLSDYMGKKFNGPNDVWVHPSGYIYFTDPYYQRPYWTGDKPEMEQHVYLLDNGTAVPVITNLKQPNGIIGTPDGEWLYVADIGVGKTFKYRIQENGSLSEAVLFAEMGSDGMTIDERGNIYLTGNGVTVFNPQGKQIEYIKIPEKWTANVTFGGAQNNQLFITASEAIYLLKMNVKGGNH